MKEATTICSTATTTTAKQPKSVEAEPLTTTTRTKDVVASNPPPQRTSSAIPLSRAPFASRTNAATKLPKPLESSKQKPSTTTIAPKPPKPKTSTMKVSTTAKPKQQQQDEVLRTVAPLQQRNPPPTVASVKHWSAAKQQPDLTYSVIHPTNIMPSATPFTSRGNGICMDLSDIFFDAAKKTATKKPLPPRTQQKKKITAAAAAASSSKQTEHLTAKAEIEEANNDEWADKQVQTFSKWLNYLFYPNEGNDDESETAALRTLVLHQQMAAARRNALSVYSSSDMVRVRKIVSSQVSRNRIALRTDQDLYANLNLRHKITSLLLNYSTPYLRLGLETLFGQVILPVDVTQFSPRRHHKQGVAIIDNDNSKKKQVPRIKLALKRFIVEKVLSDDKVLAKYNTHGGGNKCKVPSGSFGEKYRAELRTLVLYRLLVLIFFLDRLKMSSDNDDVLEKNAPPMLFRTNSPVKSTRDVLLSFCRDFLKSQGDFVKHLSRIGLKIFYKQDSIDELDFTVRNLSVDLNDGVRLARMAELLTGASLLPKLRLPAVSRLQKFHNVGLALDCLSNAAGVPLDSVASHHVVDGHREMVLKLLWSVVFHCCLQDLVTVEQVQAEIARIQRLRGMPLQPVSVDDDAATDLKAVLVQWCDIVCSFFGRHVNDLTVSFDDGKAVCYLLHYYHPTLLRLDEILPTSRDHDTSTTLLFQQETALLRNERSNGSLANKRMSELGGIPGMIPVCDTTSPPEEKSMLLCLTFLVSRLMESSVQVRACVMIQNCYRNHRERVMRARKLAAASAIFKSWRIHKSQYYAAQRNRYGPAVRVIEAFVLSHKPALRLLRLRRLAWEKSNWAAILVQVCFWRMTILCWIEIDLPFLTLCEPQKHARSRVARRQFLSLLEQNRAAIVLQCLWRQRLAQYEYAAHVRRLQAAITIQAFWRLAQLKDSAKQEAAIQIQRVFRGYWSRIQYIIDLMDIVAVQSCARRWFAKQGRARLMRALYTLQCACRFFLARKRLEEKRFVALRNACALCIQSAVRQLLAKNVALCMRKQIAVATLIQSLWRRRLAQADVVAAKFSKSQKLAAIALQSAWRRWKAGLLLAKLLLEKKRSLAAILIQSCYRKVQARRTAAAISIQSTFRMHLAQLLLAKMKLVVAHRAAAIRIQSIWRGYKDRLVLCIMQFAAARIQASIRRLAQQRHFELARNSAITIQTHWKTILFAKQFKAFVKDICLCQSVARKWLANVECQRKRTAICMLQCFCRQWLARRQLEERRRLQARRQAASVVMQRYWRGFCTFVKFRLVVQDAIVIQSAYRRWIAQRVAKERSRAVLCVQQAARAAIARQRCDTLATLKRAMERAQQCACVQIQAAYRGYLVRLEYQHLNHCALLIQRVFRGHVARIDYYLDVLDIILVQSTVRRWLSKKIALCRRDCILRLQCFARSSLARIKLSNLVTAKQRADLEQQSAATIQRVFRGFVARQLALKESSARKIQKTWRCYTIHVEYMLSILAAIDIQASARRYISMVAFEHKYCAIICLQSFARVALCRIQAWREESCAILLQSVFRMYSCRQTFLFRLAEDRSATVVQSAFRMLFSRRSFLLERNAAMMMQRYVRGFVVRIELETEHFAASEIQRMWRGFDTREIFAWHILCAIKAQSFLRMILAKRRVHECRLELLAANHLRRRSAFKIQQAFQKFLYRLKLFRASSLIQNVAREFLTRIAFTKFRRGVVRAQSVVRGRLVRRKRSEKLRDRVLRIERANLAAKADPKMTLGNQTKSALDILQNSKSLSKIMDAVCILEIATRLSENCCVSFAEAGAADILFSLIRTCNRSLPHVKLLHCVLLTMCNVAQYDDLLPSLASTAGVEVFLDLVQMFRDKDFVFCLVVALLERVVRASEEVLVR